MALRTAATARGRGRAGWAQDAPETVQQRVSGLVSPADANVLLSAICGKAASRVFTQHSVTVHMALFNSKEVDRYLPLMSKKYGISIELLNWQRNMLPVELHDEQDYRNELPRALRELKDIDIEDSHALALARSLGVPLWSNDRHFDLIEIVCYPTAKLLALLDQG